MANITEAIGSIFDAPPNSILIHACNAKGSWGGGVAVAFKQKFPTAYKVYHAYCNPRTANSNCQLRAHQQSLLGTTLLISPQKGDKSTHYIACLFTSHGYGRAVAKPDEILDATARAMVDLERQIEELKARGEEMGGCWAVRINSGKFGVPWRRSREALEGGGVNIRVVRRAEDDDGGEDAAAVDGGEVKEGKAGVWEKRKLETAEKTTSGVKRGRGGGRGGGGGGGSGRSGDN